MFRSLAIRVGMLCLALASLATLAPAQVKVAVVNTQQAILDSEEIKKASSELEKKFKLSLFKEPVAEYYSYSFRFAAPLNG